MAPAGSEGVTVNVMAAAGAMKGCTGTTGATARQVVLQPTIVPLLPA